MIKAVIFDFFGVICSDEYWNLVKQDRNTPSEFSKLADDVNLGDISWQDFLEKVAEETDEDIEQVRRTYESERIDVRVMKLVEQLHEKYKTAIVTNAHYEFFDPLVSRANLRRFFDNITISSREGVIKPNPKIFEHTLEKLGVKPEEAIFIDDISRNCDAAKAVGMQAIWYRGFPQMTSDLEKLLAT